VLRSGDSFCLLMAAAVLGFDRLAVDACSIAEAGQHLRRLIPRESEGLHMRKAQPGNHIASDLRVGHVELTFAEDIMGPGHDAGESPLPLLISCKLCRYCIPYDDPIAIPPSSHGR
jgi:hypothetical protein